MIIVAVAVFSFLAPSASRISCSSSPLAACKPAYIRLQAPVVLTETSVDEALSSNHTDGAILTRSATVRYGSLAAIFAGMVVSNAAVSKYAIVRMLAQVIYICLLYTSPSPRDS